MKSYYSFDFKKKNQKRLFSIKINFKLTSNLKQNTPGNSPDPEYETQGIGVSFPDPRGMKIAGELASPRNYNKGILEKV